MAEAAADPGGHVTIDFFAPSIPNEEQLVRGIGTFVFIQLDEVPTENGARLHVFQLVCAAFSSAASGLTLIAVERDSTNERAAANDQLPPVLSHELIKCSRNQFRFIACKHILRLQAAKLTPQQIEEI